MARIILAMVFSMSLTYCAPNPVRTLDELILAEEFRHDSYKEKSLVIMPIQFDYQPWNSMEEDEFRLTLKQKIESIAEFKQVSLAPAVRDLKEVRDDELQLEVHVIGEYLYKSQFSRQKDNKEHRVYRTTRKINLEFSLVDRQTSRNLLIGSINGSASDEHVYEKRETAKNVGQFIGHVLLISLESHPSPPSVHEVIGYAPQAVAQSFPTPKGKNFGRCRYQLRYGHFFKPNEYFFANHCDEARDACLEKASLTGKGSWRCKET